MRIRLIVFVASTSLALAVAGQESVTVPKSRLDELERKEAELERLKAEISKSKGENVQLKKQHEEDSARMAAAPVAPTHVSPPMASLPSLREGERVNALDLANHYKSDASAADQRYRGQTFLLEGQIAGFEKPPFIRPYRILLKTADPEIKIICDFLPPADYQAVFPANHGSDLVRQAEGKRVVMAKVGQNVVIQGKCKGIRDSEVSMSNCQMKGQSEPQPKK